MYCASALSRRSRCILCHPEVPIPLRGTTDDENGCFVTMSWRKYPFSREWGDEGAKSRGLGSKFDQLRFPISARQVASVGMIVDYGFHGSADERRPPV